MTGLVLLGLSGCNPPPPPKKAAAPRPKPVQIDPLAAVRDGDIEALRQALVIDPDLPNKRYSGNMTLLHALAVTPHTNLVNLLLLAGAKIDEKDAAGMTPLITAILRQQAVMAGYLIDRGADPKMTSPKGRNAFHTAVLAQVDTEMLRVMLDRGININATDNAGMTALHMAAQQGDDATVQFLLEHKADLNRRTPEGLTATEIAKQIGRIQVLALLTAKENEANPRSEIKQVETNVVAVVPPPPPPPTEAKIAPGQVMLVIMNFGGNRIPGQRDLLVRNTGSIPAKGELIWKTIDGNDNVLSGSFRLTLAPLAQQQLKIGRPIPAVTNLTTSVNSRTSTLTSSGYTVPRTVTKTTVSQPVENKFGFMAEFIIDGVLINSQSQPPDTKQRITAIQGN